MGNDKVSVPFLDVRYQFGKMACSLTLEIPAEVLDTALVELDLHPAMPAWIHGGICFCKDVFRQPLDKGEGIGPYPVQCLGQFHDFFSGEEGRGIQNQSGFHAVALLPPSQYANFSPLNLFILCRIEMRVSLQHIT